MRLLEENRRRGRDQPEFELEDTGIFDGDRYFDVVVEYAKADPDDILVRITCANRGDPEAKLAPAPHALVAQHLGLGPARRGVLAEAAHHPRLGRRARCEHATLGRSLLACEPSEGARPKLLFTDNETNARRLFGAQDRPPYTKDAFHRLVVEGEEEAVNPLRAGTKAAAWYLMTLPAGAEASVRLRLTDAAGRTSPPTPSARPSMPSSRSEG